MEKPILVSHFLHAGPALSHLSSFAELLTTSTNSISSQSELNNINSTNNPIVGLSLPTSVACSPFNKAEQARIQHAWQLLNPNYDLAKLPLQQPGPLPPSSSHLDQSQTNSTLDRKGKGRLLSESIGFVDSVPEIDHQNPATYSSCKSSIVDHQPTQNPQDQDGVLNLSMEAQPYIVPVGLDSLFTVDVRRLKLYPAFWHGPHLDVYRGEWFHPSTSKHKFYPCAPELSHALEAAYDLIKPWDLSYQDELQSALKIGTEAEDKLKVHLKEFNHDVIFQSATQGRLYSRAVSSRISKTILTNFFTSISKKTAGHSGGTVVVRGWHEAQSWSGSITEDGDQDQSHESNLADKKELESTDRPTGFNTTADMLQEEILENSNIQVSELVLVIHGIGQKLAQSYDSFDFVHACNQLRVECHKAITTDDKMKVFLQDKRTQFIPIRWRHSLNFEMESCEGKGEGAESDVEEKVPKNTFTMKDIQIPDSIQFVREIVTGLVLDVPLYMSPRQQKRMVAAVIEQANKVYRLFCHRNPYYTGRKVSILAHSLGAALTVDILSRQPNVWTENIEPDDMLGNDQECLSALDHFCFDTSKVFLVGSPVAFFFHLHRAQLIAREGVCKLSALDTKYSPEWRIRNRITGSEVGQYGCLAAETVYNVYISTDPVAYCMNACVDSQHSKRTRPIDAHSFTKQFLESIRRKRVKTEVHTLGRNVSLSSLSSLVAVSSWLGGSKKIEHEARQPSSKDKSTVNKLNQVVSFDRDPLTRPSSFINSWTGLIKKRTTPIESGEEEPAKKSKQENPVGSLRFQALNPSGSVDFVIPSLGLNQYVDMVTAHAAYWTDVRFARLILVGLFGDDELLSQVGESELEES